MANHVDHDVSDPLVAVHLDASNAFFSVSSQPQFDVLAGKASRSYDDGRVQVGDELPRPRTLDKYWGYFLSMQGNASTMRFSDNQGVTHHLPCSKGGQQGDGLENIRFSVTVEKILHLNVSLIWLMTRPRCPMMRAMHEPGKTSLRR